MSEPDGLGRWVWAGAGKVLGTGGVGGGWEGVGDGWCGRGRREDSWRQAETCKQQPEAPPYHRLPF